MRVGLVALAGGLLLSACSAAPANSGVSYGYHSYGCCAESVDTTWHAGQQLTLHWQPTPPAVTTDPNPRQIVLSLSLTGPFATVDALKQAISQGSKPSGVRTLKAAAISVTDRDVLTPSSQIELPADLPAGYYDLASQAASGNLSQSGDAVVYISR
jgi:hypothetical protein